MARFDQYRIEDLIARLWGGYVFQPRGVEVEFIAVHHTAGPADQRVSVIHDYHKSKGWAGIGYTYLVYPAGIAKVRPISAVPACVHGWNRRSVCVALVGDFTDAPPPQGQWLRAVWLCWLLRTRTARRLEVRGHHEFEGPQNVVACPGAKFDLDSFREAVEVMR